MFENHDFRVNTELVFCFLYCSCHCLIEFYIICLYNKGEKAYTSQTIFNDSYILYMKFPLQAKELTNLKFAAMQLIILRALIDFVSFSCFYIYFCILPNYK